MSSLSEERRAAMRRFSAQLDLHGPIQLEVAWFEEIYEGAYYYPILAIWARLGTRCHRMRLHCNTPGLGRGVSAAASKFARSWNCRMQIR